MRACARRGGTRSPADVRMLVVSHRDLAAEVAAGRFHADLYYRLTSFALHVPPLRDRREDIPLLVEHFMRRSARRLGRRVDRIDTATMSQLLAQDWPGNVRELRSVVERAVILAKDGVLTTEPTHIVQDRSTHDGGVSLDTVARDHIIAVLRRAHGVIEGTDGAATLLRMAPSTLRHRMRKLAIGRADYCSRQQ